MLPNQDNRVNDHPFTKRRAFAFGHCRSVLPFAQVYKLIICLNYKYNRGKLRKQNHYLFDYNFDGIPNWKLGNVSYKSYSYTYIIHMKYSHAFHSWFCTSIVPWRYEKTRLWNTNYICILCTSLKLRLTT